MHAPLAKVMRMVEEGPYARSPILTCHVVSRILTDSECVVLPPGDALPRWENARPGTLFIRDSKYCPVPCDLDTPDEASLVLDRCGRLLYTAGDVDAWVEVFVRTGGERRTATAPATEAATGDAAAHAGVGVADGAPVR